MRASCVSTTDQDAGDDDDALEAEDQHDPRVVFRNIVPTRAGVISTPARIGGTRTRMVAAA